MTPFEAYLLYSGLNAHFTTTYDGFKYNFKVNRKFESFNRRNDKYYYAKIAKHRDPQGLIVSNFVDGNITWIGDLVEDSAQEIYSKWLKRKESLTYVISDELSLLHDDFAEYFKVKDGQHPRLLRMVLQKKISKETLIALNNYLTFIPIWTKKIDDTIIWPKVSNLCSKYQPFLHYDSRKIRKIIKEKIRS